MDGDIVVLDVDSAFEVGPSHMLFKNKSSAYEGRRLKGVVKETWLRGSKIFSVSSGFGEDAGPTGKLLLEPRTS